MSSSIFNFSRFAFKVCKFCFCVTPTTDFHVAVSFSHFRESKVLKRVTKCSELLQQKVLQTSWKVLTVSGRCNVKKKWNLTGGQSLKSGWEGGEAGNERKKTSMRKNMAGSIRVLRTGNSWKISKMRNHHLAGRWRWPAGSSPISAGVSPLADFHPKHQVSDASTCAASPRRAHKKKKKIENKMNDELKQRWKTFKGFVFGDDTMMTPERRERQRSERSARSCNHSRTEAELRCSVFFSSLRRDPSFVERGRKRGMRATVGEDWDKNLHLN